MNQQLEQVRAKVIEALPEVQGQGEYGFVWCEKHGLRTSVYDIEKCPDCKFGARPIRLSDVLVAIQSKGSKTTPPPIWAIDTAGEFFDQSTSDGSPIYLDVTWNLRADSLDEQSEECIAFLANVLGV